MTVSGQVPTSVVETPQFLAAIRKLMSDAEVAALIDFLAWNPTAGDVIVGTGGVRKLRWALAGRGKSGGARVIYFHHDVGMPLFVLTAYAKNERADLSQAERNEFKRFTELLVVKHKGKSK